MKIDRRTKKLGEIIRIENAAGLLLELTSRGAAIRNLSLRDKSGTARTLTLYPDDEAFYATYHGKTVGRTAGRIAEATFSIGDKTAHLDPNNFGRDNLHGGAAGFHAAPFSVRTVEEKEYTDIVFLYTSPDGEGGYFGEVCVSVTYRVWEKENAFRILFDATADCKTLLNLTNHVYWNMSGDIREPITEQVVFLRASRVGRVNERLCIEEVVPVSEEFDFRTPHKLGDFIGDERVQRYTHGYDHVFYLDEPAEEKTACSLYSQTSGIRLEVDTTYPCVVMYANCQPTPYRMSGVCADAPYLSVCFECQYDPDGIHRSPACCGILAPNKPYHEEIGYKFTIDR